VEELQLTCMQVKPPAYVDQLPVNVSEKDNAKEDEAVKFKRPAKYVNSIY
jgi:hypothetical protein